MRIVQASVTAPASGGMITVQMPGKPATDTLPCDRQVAASAGIRDVVVVLLDDAGTAVVTAVLGTGAVAATVAAPAQSPDVATGVRTGEFAATPVFTGAWQQSGAWWVTTTDLISGDWDIYTGHQGAAWFGGQLRAQPGVIASMTVHLVRKAGGASAAGSPTMTLLAGDSRPGGAPSVLATTPGPALTIGQATDWSVPTAWLPRLSAGGDAGGIGTQANPYMRLDGTQLTARGTWRAG